MDWLLLSWTRQGLLTGLRAEPLGSAALDDRGEVLDEGGGVGEFLVVEAFFRGVDCADGATGEADGALVLLFAFPEEGGVFEGDGEAEGVGGREEGVGEVLGCVEVLFGHGDEVEGWEKEAG